MSTAARPIRRRSTFSQFRTPAGRGSAGPVQVRYLQSAGGCELASPSVAFAVGRRAGNAVTRNRIRRRLRAALGQLPPGTLQNGCYLVGAGTSAAGLPFSVLVDHVERAVLGATRVADARPGR